MSVKVIFVGRLTEPLRALLEEDFQLRVVRNAQELNEESFSEAVVIGACEAQAEFDAFCETALENPNAGFVGLVGELVQTRAAGAQFNFRILPLTVSSGILRTTVEQVLNLAGREKENELVEGTVNGCVAALFEILSIVDPYSASLGQRLRYAVDLFAKASGSELTWELETAALLAEIGVLTVPVRVLMKHQSGQELSGFEKELIANIPERAADLLEQVVALKGVADIVRLQGKNFDGTGLPQRTPGGEAIPKGARILRVLSDLFKLKESGMTHEEAIAEMTRRNGLYDPQVLAVAQACFRVNLPSNINANTLPLSLKELRPGQMLVSNILTQDGVLLIRDGQVISPRLLHKLRNFAFTSGVQEPIHVIDLLESRKMATAFHDLARSETAFITRNVIPGKRMTTG